MNNADPLRAVLRRREAEIEAILRIVNSKRAVLPQLGAFQMAPNKSDIDHRLYYTQIRAIPHLGPDRVEFRFAFPPPEDGPIGISCVAWQLLGSAHKFCQLDRYSHLGEELREAILPLLEVSAGLLFAPDLVAIGVTPGCDAGDTGLTADFEILGHDLVMGIHRLDATDPDRFRRQVDYLIKRHCKRVEVRSRADGARAIAWIDQTALRIIDATGLGRRESIERVMTDGELEASIDGPRGILDASILLFEGVCVGRVQPRDRSWNLKCGKMVIWGKGIPEVLRNSLTGRRLGQIVENHILPDAAMITRVDEVSQIDPDEDDDNACDGWLSLALEIPQFEIDEFCNPRVDDTGA